MIVLFSRYGGLTFGEERKMVPENFEDLPYDDIKRLFSRHAAKVIVLRTLMICFNLLLFCFKYYNVSFCTFEIEFCFCFQAWFNNKGYHALPVYLNSLSNTVLRSYIRKDMGNPASYGKQFSIAFIELTFRYQATFFL